jgi:O-antigen/teichoic acid export membrane protein/peptidoglycan/xylan/chitin deacetylase (PgdA/CDA1 family)
MTFKRLILRRVKWALTRVRRLWWRQTHDEAALDGLRVLFYHRISDDHDPLATPVTQFAAQMSHLDALGYRVLDVRTALDALAAGRLPRRAVALTFDDAFCDVADHAMPVLERLDQRATVFVSTRVSAGEHSFSWYREQPNVMTLKQVASLDRSSPLEFEAHTLSHPNLPRVSEDEARREIELSKAELEELLGREVTVFCYPGGFFGDRERRLVEEAGYAYGVTCEAGVNTPETDPLLIRRIQIEGTDSLGDFDAKLRGSHDVALPGRGLYRRLRYRLLPAPSPSQNDPVEGDIGGRTPSVAAGSAFYFLAQIVANGGYFFAVLLLARGLGRADRGTVAFVTISALVMSRVTGFGMGDAGAYFASRLRERRRTLLTNLLVFNGVAGVAGATLIAVAVSATGARPAQVTRLDVILFVFGTVANCYIDSGINFLIGCGRIRNVAIMKAIPPWGYGIGVGVLYATGHLTAGSAVVAWTATHCLWALTAWAILLKTSRPGRFDIPFLRRMVAYALRLWVGSVATFLNARVDQILMGFLVSEASLGTYAVAVNASEPLLILPAAAALAIIPAIAQRAPDEGAQVALVTLRTVLLMTSICVAIGLAVGGPALVFVFGNRYQDAQVPFLILLPGAIGYAVSIVLSRALLASARPGRSSLGPFISLVVGTVLDLILIRPYGATGASIAATVAFVAGGLTMMIAYRRVEKFGWLELLPRRDDFARLVDVPRAVLSRARTREMRS